MIYLILFISVIYFILIMGFIVGFDKVNRVKNKNSTPKNTFSIVVVFRNEAENLPSLLTSLSNLNYPTQLYEIILVNDDSQDSFLPIIKKFTNRFPDVNFTLLYNEITSNSPKKEAITKAVNHAKFKWIVTTDADCTIPKNWLLLFNQIIENEKPVFISAPVTLKPKNSFLFHFQQLNLTGLIGSTIGGFGLQLPFLCNGANLCYLKNAFEKVEGFEGNVTIAGGDDIFLMEKMFRLYPTQVKYLKSGQAIVQTNSQSNLKEFINQQIRWASKSIAYKNNIAKTVGIIVFAENATLVFLFIFTALHPDFWKLFLCCFLIKSVIDFLLILKTAHLIKQKKSIYLYPIISVIYPFFIVITGFLSLFKKFNWKGRTFAK